MSLIAEQLAMLRTLIAEGLTFGDCVNAFAVKSPVERAYVEAAQAKAREGELEVDGNAVVSMGDDLGAYVMAWIWVTDSEIWQGETDDDGLPCRFINHYRHAECADATTSPVPHWTLAWSSRCADSCPACGETVSPHRVVELDITGKPTDSEGSEHG